MQSGVILAAQPYGLGLNETLIPQYLKEFGYATHGVGKVWLEAFIVDNHLNDELIYCHQATTLIIYQFEVYSVSLIGILRKQGSWLNI